MIKEKPILFSTDMVRAILEGRKTQTRRILYPQPIRISDQEAEYPGKPILIYDPENSPCPGWSHVAPNNRYGLIGDVMWVRENFKYSQPYGSESLRYHYIADHSDSFEDIIDHYKISDYDRTRPSIHMPKAAARIWLEITDIKVERLQDISDNDSAKEGIECKAEKKKSGLCTFYKDYCNRNDWYWSAKASFMSLWQKINGRESWISNPWVWVISFKVLSTTGKPEHLEAESSRLEAS